MKKSGASRQSRNPLIRAVAGLLFEAREALRAAHAFLPSRWWRSSRAQTRANGRTLCPSSGPSSAPNVRRSDFVRESFSF